MIIEATRLQHGRGGKSRPSPPPGDTIKKISLYRVPFCYLFFIYGGLSATFFSFLGTFSPWGAFLLFLLHGGGLFLGFAHPLPPRKFLRAPMIARRVRQHAPRKFFCVTAISWVLDMFCYDFALKMTKIMINCSHVPARWVWRHANSRKMLVNGAIWSVFWYDFSLRKF